MSRKDIQICFVRSVQLYRKDMKRDTFVEAGHMWSGSNQRTMEDFLPGGENPDRGNL